MSLILISQCAKDLDFTPRQNWSPNLPAMAWQYRLLTGFDRSEGLVFDLSSTSPDFVSAFHACNPQLGLGELARFYAKASNINGLIETENEWMRFFALYQLRFQPSLVKVLEKINACPLSFQNWICEKGLGPRELEVLNAVCVADIKPLLEVWSELQLSKSEGAQALEYAVELFLMGTSWENILPLGPEDRKTFFTHIKRLRFPETTGKDQQRSFGLKSLPWPSQIQAQWSRQGDQAGIDIRFRVSSLSDLNKKLKGLGLVEQVLGGPKSPLQWKN